MVIEYAENKDLFDILSKANGKFPEKIARKFFIDIATGISAIHSKNICHRDLKLENVVLGKDLQAKLVDFGMAKKLVDDEEILDEYAIGTERYKPPQIINKEPYNGKKYDIF